MRLIGMLLLFCALLGASPAWAIGICLDGSYPPFGHVAPDGSVQGFNTDIAAAVCKRMNETCQMVPTEWESIIPALLDGRCDVIVASMGMTASRREVVDFTARYYRSYPTFVARKGSTFGSSVESMRGKTVGVQRGTYHQELLETRYPDTTARLYDSYHDAYLDLIAGRLDAVLGGSVTLLASFLTKPEGREFQFIGDFLKVEGAASDAGFAVRKEDTTLRDRLNAAILATRADGTYQALSNKYFGIDIYGDD